MPEQNQVPRPHGDPLAQEIGEENQAQRQSDAPNDAVSAEQPEGFREDTERTGGKGSTANGLAAGDEDEGAARRKAYDAGAELVSKID
jgi:hypothetical protein